jgi:tetratricopeptide (TPR) repeat protein
MFPLFDDAYKPSLMAQMLNDEAALLIQQGAFHEAIPHLVRALRLYEQVADAYVACTCHHCCLESCIARSKRDPPSSCMEVPSSDDDDVCYATGSYVYRQAIYCAPTFSHEGHHPGVTLMMIIIFNLALAHHLASIAYPQSNEMRRDQLSKALQLYELFYKLQMEREIFSAQAMLAVANNVGEVHRVVGNHSKYRMCLEHLMSCIMLVVEDIKSNAHVDNDSSSSSTSRSRRRSSNLGNACDSKEMQGFLNNASKLVLHNHCAGAA